MSACRDKHCENCGYAANTVADTCPVCGGTLEDD